MKGSLRSGDSVLRSSLKLLAVLAFAALILAIPAGRRPFWSSDEARFALLAQDILDHGRWFVPQLRGQLYLNKPQLYFWSIALVSIPLGRVTEFTAAIPSLISAVAGVAGVIANGQLLWGWRAGLLAGLILATTPMYFGLGHQVLADVMLNAWMIWALYFLLRARRTSRPSAPLFGFYACVGGAVASKGPEGFAALGAAMVVTLMTGGLRGLGRLRPGRGLAMLGVLSLPWLVPYLVQSRGSFFSDVLVGHYVTWYFRGGVIARLLHMATAFSNFLPWSVFLVGAVFWWRRAPDEGRMWVGVWTLTLWILLGLSGSQRARYLLPVFPGLALLTAEFLALGPARGGRRVLRLASTVFCGVALALAAVIASPLVRLVSGEDRAFVPDRLWEQALIVGLVATAAAAVALAARRGAFTTAAVGAAVSVGILLTVVGATYPPRYARHFDVRTLAAVAASHTPADGVVIGHPDLRLSYDFYLRRRVVEIGAPDAVARKLAAPSPGVLITTRERWAALAPRAAPSWRVLTAGFVADREMVVVGRDRR